MARHKNYTDKIENLNNEISATEQKLRTLYEERDSMQKEKEMSEIENIYKTMKQNNVTIEQLFASVQKPKRPYHKKPKTEQQQTAEA